MVIVDTTVWIDYLGEANTSQTKWLMHELGRQPMGLTDIILCEVLQGIRNDEVFAGVRHDLEKFHIFDTGGSDLAIASARNYRRLRKAGYTVRTTIDCLIATFCLEAGH
jgi:predicted nucleic acid-binding protein